MKDLYICRLYVQPNNSNYYDRELFEELEKDILNFATKGLILLMGDFNASCFFANSDRRRPKLFG